MIKLEIMKKISLKDVRIALKRDELRDIFGGSGVNQSTSGGSGNGVGPDGLGTCVSSCGGDSDCSCLPCNSTYGKRCITYFCNVPIGGVYNKAYRVCSC
jgi:hypothetical protein